MHTWDGFGDEAVVTDARGKIVFHSSVGTIYDFAQSNETATPEAAILLTSSECVSAHDLRDRVLAALRTQEMARQSNLRIVTKQNGSPVFEVTHYPDGDKTIFEIKVVSHDPTSEEMSSFYENVTSFLQKHLHESVSR